jgi:1-acyl-sn-glycerol-3-phosphate acyltransferase
LEEIAIPQQNKSSLNVIWMMTWILIRSLLEIFCHFEVQGTENLIGLKKPYIIAVTMHACRLDPWIVSAAIPFSYNKKIIPIRFMTYYKYIEMPIVGAFLKFAYGAYPIEPGQGLDKSLESSIDMLNNGEVIGIFPEGGLSKDGRVREAKTGTVYLATKTNVPILPVYLGGNFNLTLLTFFSFRKRVKVSFGQLIYPNDLLNGLPQTDASNLQRATNLLVDKIASLSKI